MCQFVCAPIPQPEITNQNDLLAALEKRECGGERKKQNKKTTIPQ